MVVVNLLSGALVIFQMNGPFLLKLQTYCSSHDQPGDACIKGEKKDYSDSSSCGLTCYSSVAFNIAGCIEFLDNVWNFLLYIKRGVPNQELQLKCHHLRRKSSVAEILVNEHDPPWNIIVLMFKASFLR
ncbi:hypothetical protein RJ641_019067 [Dillenia turbinata]|uniref:Uncharacterized protein n=1 Tax=Dillenia turbinata TaxID=194707 RepID=A0AAN8UQR5_9MAGN